MDIVLYVPRSFSDGRFRQFDTLSQSFNKLHIVWIALREEESDLAKAINKIAKFTYHDLFSTDKDDVPKEFIELNW